MASGVREEMRITLAERIEDVLQVMLPEVAQRLHHEAVGT